MRPVPSCIAVAAAVIAAIVFVPSTRAQQQPYIHINSMVEKLAAGKPVIGIQTTDYSMENARLIARSDVDFVRLEFEHGPMNFEVMRNFLIGMVDKQSILKKGNPQVSVVPLARFAPYGNEDQSWIVKQALDIGIMGYIANGVDNKEQAAQVVKYMRYPALKGSNRPGPNGARGFGPFNATWFWGIDVPEYVQRADVYPLNPRGDLIAAMMIETVEGLKNVDEIAGTPGVGMIFPGNATDLSYAMGVPFDSPEREAALQTILRACIKHNVACGIAAVGTPAEAEKRVKEGWKYIELSGAGVLNGAGEATLKAARAASR